GLAPEGADLLERGEGEEGAGPGAEVLGGEVVAADLAQVGVHVGGGDVADDALLVLVAEQLLAGHVLAAAHDAGDAGVLHLDLVLDAGLAAEAEPHAGAPHFGVVVADGGEAVGAVLPRVLGVAHAGVGGLQEADHGGEDLLARDAGEVQVAGDAGADARQRLAEGGHSVVLGGVARLAPARMISVLLPSARVAPGGLEVPLGVGADPHVRPGGRDGEAPDAGEGLAILDGAAARVDVGEAFPCAAAPEARLRVGDVAEARLVRGIRGLGRQRDDGLHARAMRRARRSAFWPVQRWRRPEAIAAPAATGGSIQAATPPPSSAPEIHVRIASAPRAPATRGRTRRETRARARSLRGRRERAPPFYSRNVV